MRETMNTVQRDSSFSKRGPSVGEREVLAREVATAEEAYAAARKRRDEARAALDKYDTDACGIALGDMFEKDGSAFRVSRLEVWRASAESEPLITAYGQQKLKDGSFGVRSRYLGMHAKWNVAKATGNQGE